MKTLLAGLLSAGFALALRAGESGAPTENVASAEADADALRFMNGDSLRGSFMNVEADGTLRYQRTDTTEPFAFRLDAVRELQLAPRPLSAARKTSSYVVELTNGDKLAGDIIALDESRLRFATVYAGVLELKRAMISRVSRNPTTGDTLHAGPTGIDDWITVKQDRLRLPDLYAGPTGIDDWIPSPAGRNLWAYREAAFYSPLSAAVGMGRNMNLPDSVVIEFDLEWRTVPSVEVGVFVNDIARLYASGGYVLRIDGSSAVLQRFPTNGIPPSALGRMDISKYQRNNKTRISLRVNQSIKLLELVLNNECVGQWTDHEDFAGRGKGVILATSGCENRISKLVVTPWNGLGPSDVCASASQETGGSVVWANGDQISGAIKRLNKRDLIVVSTLTSKEMKTPLDPVLLMSFARQNAIVPRQRAADVRVVLRDGNRFTLALRNTDDRFLYADAEVCGPVSVALDAIASVRFHLYESASGSQASACQTQP